MTDPVAPSPESGAELLNAAGRQVSQRIGKLEALLATGTAEAINEVLLEVESLKILLAEEPLSSSESRDGMLAAVLTAEGHAMRVLGRLEESLARYAEVIELLGKAPDSEAKNRQAANLWTAQGIGQLAMNEPAAAEKALVSFDQAISLRSATAPLRSAGDRWALAATWLNRADALAFLGGAVNLTGAIDATRAAREAISVPDPTGDASLPVRLALTLMKESELSARRWIEFRSGTKEEVCDGFLEAIALLRPAADAGDGEARRVLATVLTNLSRTRLYLGESGSSEGEAEALEAINRIGDAEARFVEAAVLAATARLTASLHVANSPQWHERSIEVTDLVEDGLAGITKWRKAGLGQVFDEGLVAELLHLGAEGYLTAAPHFLGDFLLDQLDPERNEDHFADLGACCEVAEGMLAKGISIIQKLGFTGMTGDEHESRQALLEAWEQCRERLDEIRPA